LRKRRRSEYERAMIAALELWQQNKAREVRTALDQFDPSRTSVEEDMRGFEWYYLDSMLATGVQSLHVEGQLRTARFSPNGKTLAVLGYDGRNEGNRITLFDAVTGKVERTLALGRNAVVDPQYGSYTPSSIDFGGDQGAAFSPNGRFIAGTCVIFPDAKGPTGILKVWDVATGQEAISYQDPALSGLAVAFSPDGAYVLSGGYSFAVLIWKLSTRDLVWRLPWYQNEPGKANGFEADAPKIDGNNRSALQQPVGSLASVQGNHALLRSTRVLASTRGAVRESVLSEWPPNGRQPPAVEELRRLAPPAKDESVSIAPEGQWALFTDENRGAIYLKQRGIAFATARQSAPRQNTSKSAQKRRRDASTDTAGTGSIKLESGTVKAVSAGRDAIALAGDKGQVTYARIDPKSLQLTEPTNLRGHTGMVVGVAFSPSAKALAAVGLQDVTVWDLTARAEVKTLEDLIPARQVVNATGITSRDGRWAIVSQGPNPLRPVPRTKDSPAGEKPAFQVVDTSQPQDKPRDLDLPPWGGAPLAISLEGLRVALASGDSYVMNEMRRRMAAAKGSRPPQSRGPDPVIHVLDIKPGAKPWTLKGLTRQATSLMFDNDGKRLLSSSRYENVVRLWDIESGLELREFRGLDEGVENAELSLDERWVVAGDRLGKIAVWSVERPEPVKTFRIDRGAFEEGRRPTWAIVDSWLALPDESKQIVIWSLETREPAVEIAVRGRQVDALAFISNRSRLVSMNSNELSLWSVDTGSEILSLPAGALRPQNFPKIVTELRRLEAKWKARQHDARDVHSRPVP
jgi:WD40 repeat protein